MRPAKILRHAMPVTGLVTALAVLTTYAVLSNGVGVQRADLNNSGIWASSDLDGTFGRFNKAASVLEVSLVPNKASTNRVDVYQDGDTVVARDRQAGTLVSVDTLVSAANLDTPLALPAQDLVELRGGTLAVLDPDSGKLWAVRTGGSGTFLDLSMLDPSAPPLAELGQPGPGPSSVAMSVAADGSVHAASASGKTVRVPVTDAGFGDPVEGSMPTMGGVQIAALGERTAVLDPTTGTVRLPDGGTAQVPRAANPALAIQQGGADTGAVYVATATSLVRVDFAGQVSTLFSKGGGAPAAPVVLSGCAYGAWAGVPGRVAYACADDPPVDLTMDDNAAHAESGQALVDPVFRVNWNQLLLNDRFDGRIYDVALAKSLDDWSSITPKNQQRADDEANKPNSPPKKDTPEATADEYSVRPSRTSVLHVLDNDTDPTGSVLSIVSASAKGPGQVTIAPDGQTILYTQPATGGDAKFTYTVSNTAGKQSSAAVTIKADGPDDNGLPKLRDGWTESTAKYQVAAGRDIQLPVAEDFRDPDCDPVTLIRAGAARGVAAITPAGLIDFTAPLVASTTKITIDFDVTDGFDSGKDGFGRVPGSVVVTVVGADDPVGAAPRANPDVARGEAGTPVTVYPLANDLPGADPGNPRATLALAADVQPLAGVAVATDRTTGRVTVTASEPGIYVLSYVATFGSAPSASSTIRVDVAPGSARGVEPIAVPDVAVVHGQEPAMVDVTVNDIDPRGGLLTVQSATPADAGLLSVGLVRGRWLRIVANQPDIAANPTSVGYTITNGTGADVRGWVTVTQLPETDDDLPVLRDDFADVRAGDSVLIPALANDTSTGGSPLRLVTNDPSRPDAAAGTLKITDPAVAGGEDPGDLGSAYVAGSSVRYVAPERVDTPRRLEIAYLAQTNRDELGAATIWVTVHPQPTDAAPNSPPIPLTVEERVVTGDTTVIPIPSSGQDPDGDSVVLVGIGSPPTHGRILSLTPGGLEYQAYPDDSATGTDEFSYQVADRFGKTATGTVRVGVVPPGQTQPPMPVDDPVIAQPGAKVSVDVVSNDYLAQGDPAVITSVTEPGELAGAKGPVVVTAPAPDAPTTVVQYELTGNADTPGVGKVLVTGRDGYVNPPHALDHVAGTQDGRTAAVDVLAGAWDPVFGLDELTVEVLNHPAASVSGSVVTVPMGALAQVFCYRVTNPDGGQTAALVYVPAAGDGPPYPVGEIEMPQDATMSVALGDYVKSRRGKPVRITTDDTLSASPAHLLVSFDSLTGFTLTSTDGYIGPAAVSVEVTDGSSLTDPSGRTAMVTIPVQIGPVTPVLRCPDADQLVQIGQTGKTVDLTSLCHVWTAEGVDPATLTYATEWTAKPASVDALPSPDGRGVQLSARGDAKPNATGTLEVRVVGAQAVPGEIHVRVVDAAKPRVGPISARVRAGETARGQLLLASPLRNGRQDTIVAIDPSGGTSAADAQVGGVGSATWSVTPARDLHGTLRYRIVVSDVADTSRLNRQQSTTLAVAVYNVPDAPGQPQLSGLVESRQASLSWKAPANNGAPITKYTLATLDESKTWTCASTACVATGLTNATAYAFKVRATNQAGDGPWGPPSAATTPNHAPSVVTGLQSSDPADGSLTLSWSPMTRADCDCDVLGLTYVVSWPGGSQTVAGTSVRLGGLANVETTFSVVAVNGQGRSPRAATVTGWPSGAPGPFTLNAPQAANLDVPQTALTLSWSAAFPNGQGPVQYWVTDNGRPVPSCQGGTATSCRLDGLSLGSGRHLFTVTAKNNPGRYETTASVSWDAEGNPPKLGAPTVTGTGGDQTISVSGTTPNSLGPAGMSYVEVYVDGTLAQTVPVDSAGGPYSATVTSPRPNGTAVDVTVQLCYTSVAVGQAKCGGRSAATPVTPFGPLGDVTLTVTAVNNVLDVTATADANGAGATLALTHDGSEPQCKTSRAGASVLTLSCSLAIEWDDSRTFTATLTSDATTPARAATSQTVTGRTAAPAPMTLSDVTVTASGFNLHVRVTGDGHGLGAQLAVTGPCAGSDTGTGSLIVEFDCPVGYDSGVRTFTATMTNTDQLATRDPVVKQGSGATGAPGRMELSDLDVKVEGYFVHVTATANGNGLAAQLDLTGPAGCDPVTKPLTGPVTETMVCDLGYGSGPQVFTATLTNKDPHSTRQTITKTGQGQTPEPGVMKITEARVTTVDGYKVRVLATAEAGGMAATLRVSMPVWCSTTLAERTGNYTDAGTDSLKVEYVCSLGYDFEGTFTVTLTNDDPHSNRAPQTRTVAGKTDPAGELVISSMTVTPDGHNLRVAVTGDTGYQPGTLRVWSEAYPDRCTESRTATGPISVVFDCDVGYNSGPQRFVAQLGASDTVNWYAFRMWVNASATGETGSPPPMSTPVLTVTTPSGQGYLLHVVATGDAGGLGALLTVTGPTAACSKSVPGTGVITVIVDCVLGYNSGPQTFTATMTNTDTHAVRSEKTAAPKTGSTATADPVLAEPQITVTPNGYNLKVSASGDGGGANATLRVDGPCQSTSEPKPGVLSVSFDCDVGYNSGPKEFVATLTNSDSHIARASTSQRASGATSGPPELSVNRPTITDLGNGSVRVSATGNGGGLAARLTLSGPDCSDSATGANVLPASCTANIGYNATAEFTATVENTDSHGTMRDPKRSSNSITTGPRPPEVTISRGVYSPSGTGWHLTITTRYTRGTYQCVFRDDSQSPPLIDGSMTLTGDYSGQSGSLYGFMGDLIWAECSSATLGTFTSNKIDL